jgi:hypothetical protein
MNGAKFVIGSYQKGDLAMHRTANLIYLTILQYQPSRSHDSDLGPLIFLVFVGLALIAIAAFTVGAIIYSSRKRSDRAGQLQAVARQIGYSFSQTPGVPAFLKNTRYAQWYPAVGTGIHNLLAGNVNGTTVFIFDFGYTLTAGGFGSATFQETIACIPQSASEPFFFYRDRTLVSPEHIKSFLDATFHAFAETGKQERSLSLAG